jgi:hypothetical protein
VTEAFAFTSVGFAIALACALWRLVCVGGDMRELRDELAGLTAKFLAVNQELATQQLRTKGYKDIAYKLRVDVDAKNKMLKDAGVKPGAVIDGLLSNEGGNP